jgi:hypothetical protein
MTIGSPIDNDSPDLMHALAHASGYFLTSSAMRLPNSLPQRDMLQRPRRESPR